MADVKLTLMDEERALLRASLSQMKAAAIRNAAKAVVPELRSVHERLHSRVMQLLDKLDKMGV